MPHWPIPTPAWCHTRWLTTANKLFRLCMATESPSDVFVTIVKFIMIVYALMWFEIRSNPSITIAFKHLYETIVKVGKLDCRTQQIIKPVIQRHAYYDHHENIRINMIQDEKEDIRELGWRRILKARRLAASAPIVWELSKYPISISVLNHIMKWLAGSPWIWQNLLLQKYIETETVVVCSFMWCFKSSDKSYSVSHPNSGTAYQACYGGTSESLRQKQQEWIHSINFTVSPTDA